MRRRHRVALFSGVLALWPAIAAGQPWRAPGEPAQTEPLPPSSPEPSPPPPASPSPIPDADATASAIAALRAEIASLRARLDSRPAAAPDPVTHDRGFSLTTADGRYRLDFGGYLQGRYSTVIRAGTASDGGFLMRRARWIVDATLDEALQLRTMIELAGAPLLLDAYADWRLSRWLTLRAGRDKTPYTRSYQIPGNELTFPDRPLQIDAMRWGRDLGVQLRWRSPLVHWQVFVGNGALDGATEKFPSLSGRLQWAVSGDVIDGASGAGAIHDEAHEGAATMAISGVVDSQTPATVSGIVVDADADDDGKPGRVIVIAGGFDLTIRGGAFEAIAEVLYRYEDWSTLLRATPDLAAIVGRESKQRFAGAYLDATYMVWPERMLVGLRFGYSDLPFLSMRTTSIIPPGENVLEAAATVVLYRRGRRLLGASYGIEEYGAEYGTGVDGGLVHRAVVEAQLEL